MGMRSSQENVTENTDLIRKSPLEHSKEQEDFTVMHTENNGNNLDGGWGWMVCFGAFIVHILTVGQQNIAGVIYSVLVDEFGTKRAETAWVTGLSSCVMYFFAPVGTFLAERLGCRRVVIIGGLLSATGLATSSFAPNILTLYFTYGLCWGIGTSFGLFPSLVILTKYFRRRLAMVTGMALTGAAIGGIALGPMVQVFAQAYSTPNMFRFLGALNVLVIFSGLLYRPLKDKKNNKDVVHQPMMVSLRTLISHRGYVIWVTALCTLMLVFLVPFVHLVKLAEDKHTGKGKSSLLAGFMAAGGLIGSLVFGKLSDHPKCNRIMACQFSILSMGVVCTLVTIANSFTLLSILAFAFGIFDGCYEMLVPVITSDIVGLKLTPTAIGSLYCVLAIPKAIGPPMAGWIFDVSQSYNTAFYVTGGLMTLSSCIMFLIPSRSLFQEVLRISSSVKDIHINNDSEYSSKATSSDDIPIGKPTSRKLKALTCYALRFKPRQTTDDFYTINGQEHLLVTEKITCV